MTERGRHYPSSVLTVKKETQLLRDAKKEGLVPSVTTVLNIVAKPSLEKAWKINKALEASIELQQGEDEPNEEFIYRCGNSSERHRCSNFAAQVLRYML